jgi:hypothetical protein
VTPVVRTRAVTAALLSGLLVAGICSHGSAAGQTACKRVSRHVILNLNDDKHHHVIDHAFDARRAGHPRILHIRRQEADANRRASLRGIPTRRGYDRDEYPPALSDEGGRGAHRPLYQVVGEPQCWTTYGHAAPSVLQRAKLRFRTLGGRAGGEPNAMRL